MSNNPFMSESNLPEGTVFIAVGSIIGGFGFLLVLWRIIATVSLKRAADRARKDQKLDMYSADQKTPLFASGGRGNPSSEDLGLNSNSTSLRNPTMTGGSMNGPQPGLFFSPTAEVMNSANNGGSFMGGGSLGGSGTGGNARNSVYMPAGYYDSGATGGGAPSITSRSTRHFSMARDSMYGGLGVRSSVIGGGNRQNSEYMPQQRAPSAYLDDLLAHEED